MLQKTVIVNRRFLHVWYCSSKVPIQPIYDWRATLLQLGKEASLKPFKESSYYDYFQVPCFCTTVVYDFNRVHLDFWGFILDMEQIYKVFKDFRLKLIT